MTEPTKVIAFYLPQFHPVAENDAWWEPGFTEWTNVAKAEPLFLGHPQPKLPGELGFYDLRVPEVRERQAAMARRHGIDGFMYYHYWFGGQQVLDRCFDEVLRTGRPDLPFCLCWANENWTRVWDASEDAILLEQRYHPEERAAHIRWLVAAFADPRYIRVQGRPLFAVYRIQSLPDSEGFVAELRAAASDAGLPDLYLVKFDTHGNVEDPTDYGCDAAAQFLPHGVGERVPTTPAPDGISGPHLFFRYDDVAKVFCELAPPAWTRHESVVTGWDNTARRREAGALIVLDNTPERYEQWLRTVYERAPDRGGIVFLNAWNEWAEGAYLEPDDRWGDSLLRATARVVLGREPAPVVSPPEGGREEVLCGPSFAELYLDVYERYVHARRQLTSFENAVRREVDRRTEALSQAVMDERARSQELAGLLESLLAAQGSADPGGVGAAALPTERGPLTTSG